MENDIEKLLAVIKEQVQMFLLDAGEFYPFGTCIDENGQIIPVSAFLDHELPSSLELIYLLENQLRQGIKSGHYKLAALVIDVVVSENDIDFDAIQLRIFEGDGAEKVQHVKYITYTNYIDFQ